MSKCHAQSLHRNDPCPCGSLKKTKICCGKVCCPDCLTSQNYQHLRQKNWLLEKSLVRVGGLLHSPRCRRLMSFKPQTIVICGNGAEGYFHNQSNDSEKGDNVWNLIEEVVTEFKATSEGKGVGIPSRGTNCLHWVASTERLVAHYGTEKPQSMDPLILAPANVLRELISKKLANAKINLRKMECFCGNCTERLPVSALASCGVITLNWGTAIQELPNTVHLHGKINHPECLVLPNQDFIKLQPQNGKFNQGFGSFNTARNWFDHCQNVIVWGCNLNDYDSILLTVLTSVTINKQHRMNFFICKPNKISLEEKLKDYFPLANFVNCLSDFKKQFL